MLNLFVYAVSTIMVLWHRIIQGALAEGTAWLVSIVLLVITVRGLISPLSWMSIRSGRVSALMRPEINALPTPTTVEEAAAHRDAVKEIHARYNYRPAVGCVPPLIMIPVFIGLYRLILRMARPTEEIRGIGMLSAQEVADFRATTFEGIPLPAFVAMPEKWATDLGVSGEQVREVITPLLIFALIFTATNMTISVVRGFYTTEFDSAFRRRLLYYFCFMAMLTPFLLWHVAMSGPIPVAIIIYWFTTNLFTLLQTCTFEFLLRRKYPLGQEHHQMRRESIARFREHRRLPMSQRRQAKKQKKAAKRERSQLEREMRRVERQRRKDQKG